MLTPLTFALSQTVSMPVLLTLDLDLDSDLDTGHHQRWHPLQRPHRALSTCTCSIDRWRSSSSRAAHSCASLGGAAGGSGSGTDVTPRYCDGRDGRALRPVPML